MDKKANLVIYENGQISRYWEQSIFLVQVLKKKIVGVLWTMMDMAQVLYEYDQTNDLYLSLVLACSRPGLKCHYLVSAAEF